MLVNTISRFNFRRNKLAHTLTNTISNGVVCYLTQFPGDFNYYIPKIIDNLSLGTVVVTIQSIEVNSDKLNVVSYRLTKVASLVQLYIRLGDTK